MGLPAPSDGEISLVEWLIGAAAALFAATVAMVLWAIKTTAAWSSKWATLGSRVENHTTEISKMAERMAQFEEAARADRERGDRRHDDNLRLLRDIPSRAEVTRVQDGVDNLGEKIDELKTLLLHAASHPPVAPRA